MHNAELRMIEQCRYPRSAIRDPQSEIRNLMAERVGFEPTERFPAHSISSAANSTTLAPLLTIAECGFRIADWRDSKPQPQPQANLFEIRSQIL